MGKKIVIALVVLMISMVAFLPEITRLLAKKAFKVENRNKSWAPKTAYRAGVINMRFWRFKSGRIVLEKARSTFPGEEWVDEAEYQIALCYEKSGDSKSAIAQYQLFISNYPNHKWAGQAGKRIDSLTANL